MHSIREWFGAWALYLVHDGRRGGGRGSRGCGGGGYDALRGAGGHADGDTDGLQKAGGEGDGGGIRE